MEFSALAAFVSAAERQGFTPAAAALGITASGVSKAISRLEDELQIRLFNRSTRSLSLTTDGAVFYERCRQILSDMEDAKLAMIRAQSEPSGRLRVSMPSVFGKLCIIPAIAAFMMKYPKVSIEASITDRFVDVVEEGFDIVIRMGEAPDSRMVARHLGETRFLTAASPEYLRTHGIPSTPEELPNHFCIAYISPLTRKTLEWMFVDGGKSFKHVPAGRLSVDNGEAVVNAAICHSGIIHCHEYMIKRELTNGSLVQVLENFVPRPEPIAAMYPRNRHLTPRVRFFVDFLLDYLDCPAMAT